MRSAALAAGVFLSVPSAGGIAYAAADGRELPPAGAVTALSVVPGSGHADVVIAVEGPSIEIIDFVLENPHRVVVDLKGATLSMPARLYDKISRGGITNIRMAQWKPEIVRVVLDLDGAREYTVVREDHDVRVSVTGPVDFAAWRIGGSRAAVVSDVSVTAPGAAAAAAPAAPPVPVDPPAKMETPRNEPAPKSAPVKAEPQQSQEPRISVDFQDTDIRDVITSFAVFSGRTIVVGKGVTGAVTASIKDQPWDVAMRSILQSQGLSAVEDATGIITVDSYVNISDRAKVEPLYTKVIPVNYAKAEVMATTVKSLLGAGCGGGASGGGGGGGGGGGAAAAAAAPGATTCSARGSASFDEKTNTVIVTETPSRLADIESYIHDLDIRTPQVSIKTKIISVDRTSTEQLGLSYDLGSANTFSNQLVTRFVDAAGTQAVPGSYRVNLSGDGLAGVANATRQYQSTSALSLIYNMTLGGFNLTSFLDAMSQQQLTDVQAEPSVTTVDNKEATLFAGQNIKFLLTPPIVPGQIQATAPQIQTQDIGITLKVTPHVTANRQVLMDVYTEETVLQTVTVAGPNVAKRNSTNQVLVGDGETAVISGLTQTQIVKNRTGIPFLMNLPGIGKLFSQSDNQERKQDLLILVTPHIVDEGEVIGGGPRKP
ncbi:MAG TPA: secretin N-terminal domain-containing protein [Gemmatimonadaceae bacterium]|nr:secretin N-terminal domain-containing protein [Gemmatimonadaceae bacterium]